MVLDWCLNNGLGCLELGQAESWKGSFCPRLIPAFQLNMKNQPVKGELTFVRSVSDFLLPYMFSSHNTAFSQNTLANTLFGLFHLRFNLFQNNFSCSLLALLKFSYEQVVVVLLMTRHPNVCYHFVIHSHSQESHFPYHSLLLSIRNNNNKSD